VQAGLLSLAHFLLSWFWNIKGLSQTSDSAKTVTMAGISRATHASTNADEAGS
jgi:hypothetical protein